jgi:flagellar basal body-associated protein FliL
VAKVKLDRLEQIPELEAATAVIDVELNPEEATVLPPRNWALNKLVLIAAPIAVLVILVAGGLWLFLKGTPDTASKAALKVKKEISSGVNIATPSQLEVGKDQISVKSKEALSPVTKKITDVSGSAVSVKVNTVHYKDFVIDIKSNSGKNNVLTCDVALEMAETPKLADPGSNTDVRKIIYRIIQSRSAIALRSQEERKKMKKEIVQELDKLLGAGVIQDVYFINYFIM